MSQKYINKKFLGEMVQQMLVFNTTEIGFTNRYGSCLLRPKNRAG
jgi:hypothetical protein